jgi:hypothetical protein
MRAFTERLHPVLAMWKGVLCEYHVCMRACQEELLAAAGERRYVRKKGENDSSVPGPSDLLHEMMFSTGWHRLLGVE